MENKTKNGNIVKIKKRILGTKMFVIFNTGGIKVSPIHDLSKTLDFEDTTYFLYGNENEIKVIGNIYDILTPIIYKNI